MKRIGRLIGRAIKEDEEIETSIHHLGLFFHRNNQVASTPTNCDNNSYVV